MLTCLLSSCGEENTVARGAVDFSYQEALVVDSIFLPGEALPDVEHPDLAEASGLAAASYAGQGLLWSHNDSGDTARVFLLTEDGRHKAMVFFPPQVSLRDWEDMAVGPGPEPGQQYLYIADMGDNRKVYESYFIYRVKEPPLDALNPNVPYVMPEADVIEVRYPEGKRDAECLMIDPDTRDLYVVSTIKSRFSGEQNDYDDSIRVYRLPFAQQTAGVQTLQEVARLGLRDVNGGDISRDGQEVLLKTYNGIYYWRRRPGESFAELFTRDPERLPYLPGRQGKATEPQGEALAWKPDGSGFYSISEENYGVETKLYYYARNTAHPKNGAPAEQE